MNLSQRKWTFLVSLFILISGCQKSISPVATTEPTLISTLRQIEGQFVWRDDLRRYIFTAPDKLEAAVSAATPVAAVPILVECLDNSTPSTATLNGEQVPVGAVCYQALSQTVSHEENAPDNSGDIAKSWPGHIDVKADQLARIAAKQAWQKVLKEKTYGFL